MPISSSSTEKPSRTFVQRWGGHDLLFQRGFVVIPSTFLRNYSHLKPNPMSGGEALFVLHLMEFKWDAKKPFPGYQTLARRMGVSDKAVRRYAQALEAKGLLKREFRKGRTNLFDLGPLFEALRKLTQKRGPQGT